MSDTLRERERERDAKTIYSHFLTVRSTTTEIVGVEKYALGQAFLRHCIHIV